MRSYCAVYVDVGYLLASAATRVTGTSLRRGIQVDYAALIQRLVDQAQEDSGLPLLRVNWYDSGSRPGGMPDMVQETIGLQPRVKLRLGRRSHSGDQKGVDVRMGLDLAIQGRNHVADVIYLASGDDDLTEAVEEAQAHGIQVILLAVPDHAGRPHAVSRHLQRAADGVIVIDADGIDETVKAMAIPEGLLASVTHDEGYAETPPGQPADGQTAPGERTDDGAVGERVETTVPAAPAPAERATDTGAAASTSPRPGPPAPRPGSVPAGTPQGPVPAAPVKPPAPTPATPSPLALARKKATEVVLPGAGVPPLPTDEEGLTVALVDDVARQVVASWCKTAQPESLARLRSERPIVPGELDRALLVDLSSRSGVYDIDDQTRYAVRERFWWHVDRVRVT